MRSELGAGDWPLIVADSSDAARADATSRASTRVVATTVGPYREYGMALVEACAAAGTHYADLTGEVLFMRDTIERFHDGRPRRAARGSCTPAASTRSRRTSASCCCTRRPGEELEDTTLVVQAMKGGLSGGTIASMKGQVDEMKRRPRRSARSRPTRTRSAPTAPPSPTWARRATSCAPVARRRPRHLAGAVRHGGDQHARRAAQQRAAGLGLRPALPLPRGDGHGRRASRGRAKATALAGGVGALVGGLSFGPTRTVLDRVLPVPGRGPERGGARARASSRSTSTRGRRAARGGSAAIAAQGDPGYAATAVMLGESALAWRSTASSCPPRAGVLTPATAMGTALVDRLRAAGHTYDVERL